MQKSYGVPLAESVQFERCEVVADAALPVFLHLRRLAADGQVIYSDDTRVKILLSLIETCRLNGGSAWAYLLWLIRNRSQAQANPSGCLP